MIKKIKYLFYSLLFLALNFPAKAFGMYDLYGSPTPMQVKYGVLPNGDPSTPGNIQGWFFSANDSWQILLLKMICWIVIPVLLIFLIIKLIIKRVKRGR